MRAPDPRHEVRAQLSFALYGMANRGRTRGAPDRIALPVANNNQKTAMILAELVSATGFDALHFGALQDSWRHQPGTPAYCTELTTSEIAMALKTAELKAPGEGA